MGVHPLLLVDAHDFRRLLWSGAGRTSFAFLCPEIVHVDLQRIVEKYGPDRIVLVQGDIGIPKDNARVVKAAIDAFGELDGLILNAASLEPFGE